MRVDKVSRRKFAAVSVAGITGMCGCTKKEDSPKNPDTGATGGIHSEKLRGNARIVLEASCRAQKGETVLLLADDVLLPYAPAMAEAALEIGLIPTIVDIRHYILSEQYKNGYILESLKTAMEVSDIVIENLADTWVTNRPGYGRLTGNPDMHDKALSGERRWMILQCSGLDEWDVTAKDISIIPQRTKWLHGLLRGSEKGHITSPGGTDFSFRTGKNASLVPVLGIIPFYGEVAVRPDLKGTSGIVVVDGPTQRNVRPADELDREPLRITVEDGKAVDMSGEEVQLKRLREFIASGDPPAVAIDEVGILTTTLKENDLYYWSDGTHHHDRSHIALGNNPRRTAVVHGPKHMDGEVCRPTISIDGRVIMKDGIFQDETMNL